MANVLVLGAGGRIARLVVDGLGRRDGVSQTLFVRTPSKIRDVPFGATVVKGDALDAEALTEAARGQDVVYANLTGGDIDAQAENIVNALAAAGVDRLIFVASLGILDEVPGAFGEWNSATIGEVLEPFRRASDTIEASGLDYTVVRPAWLDDSDEVSYEVTHKGESFRGTVVSRKSVADVIEKVIVDPSLYSRDNIGVNKPGTDGDKPYFM